MMLQVGDDGVVSSVNEEDLIYVDKKELEQFIESYQKLEKENEQLKQAIAETEKMVQSTYDELTKLRCIKKNIIRIKHSWDYLMEAIQYD